MSGEVVRLPKGASVPVTLKVLEYELFHFCPLKVSFRGVPLLLLFAELLLCSGCLLNDMIFVGAGDHIQHLIRSNRSP